MKFCRESWKCEQFYGQILKIEIISHKYKQNGLNIGCILTSFF